MIFYVSRQHYYYNQDSDGQVEIVIGGIDYSGPDTLCEKYRRLGEGQEFNDPRAAVKAAIEILKHWQQDEPEKENLFITAVSLGGMGLEGEPWEEEALLKWADKMWENIPKCDECGDPLDDGPHAELYLSESDPDLRFCTEHCLDRWEQKNILLMCTYCEDTYPMGELETDTEWGEFPPDYLYCKTCKPLHKLAENIVVTLEAAGESLLDDDGIDNDAAWRIASMIVTVDLQMSLQRPVRELLKTLVPDEEMLELVRLVSYTNHEGAFEDYEYQDVQVAMQVLKFMKMFNIELGEIVPLPEPRID